MFESLVVTLREGVEAALIVAIVLAYLRKIGRMALSRSVYLALAAAVLASLGGAALLSRIQINEEAFEGWTMLIASVFITSMVIWMWRTSKRLKAEIESRVDQIATADGSSSFSFSIFIFVFLMVAREGIETVLLLSAVQLNTTAMVSFIGGLIGLLLAIIFGVLFVKGSIRVNLRKFFSVTSLILIVVAVQLFVSGLHELSEARLLPASAREMAIIGPIVKSQALFYVVVLGLTIFLILRRTRSISVNVDAGANAADRRKAIYRARRERLVGASLATIGVAAIVLITTHFVYSINAGTLSPPEDVFVQGSDVTIPLSAVDDGNLHRFAYEVNGGQLRFIVIKLETGELGVAFDACPICGDLGYFQIGRDVVCKNCTAAINPVSIGQPGGCNPIPLPSTSEDGKLHISHIELENGAGYFKSASVEE